jgi:hypothetical protein
VAAANGLTILGIAYKRARIYISVNGHARSIILTDILHVPQIKGNLIFIARLQDKGLVVKTTIPLKKLAIIIKDYSRKVSIASKVGKSYVLNMLIESIMPIKLLTNH